MIAPAGEMWSVVTLSPSLASTRAPRMSSHLRRLGLHALEVRRVAHVRGVGAPGVAVAVRHVEARPVDVAVEDLRVALAEHVLLHGLLDRLGDLLRARPDVAQEDVGAVRPLPDRIVQEVDVHRPGERVGHDERRRGEVVHLHVGVDAALEVAVAREHRADGEVVRLDGRRDLLRERAGVADAGRAAVADEVEAERVEVVLQVGAQEVVGDDLRAGGERRLDPRLRREALRQRVAGEQAGGEHHRRVRRVRAARDRGDHDVAVVELAVGPVGELHRHGAAVLRRAPRATRGPRR